MTAADHAVVTAGATRLLDRYTANALDRYFPDARPTQQPPTSPWLNWLILAGRGFGKTRTGAEWIINQALTRPGTRWAVVAPTFADGRDTCIEGESGALAVLHRRGHQPGSGYRWNRSMGELILANESRVKVFSGDEPERLRGPQHHGAWVDEPASFRYPDAWDQLQFGLRLGDHPRTVVTGTPKPVKLIRQLVAREAPDDVVVTRGSTFDNSANLAPSMLAELEHRYQGTRLGRQELYAEILDDVEGALWSSALIEQGRVADFPDLVRLVVAVDPAVTSGEESDETGIVAVGAGYDGDLYVIEDVSLRGSPQVAMGAAVSCYRDLMADRLVVERNNGGDYLPAMVRTIDPGVAVETVVATRGKALRAEPVAALYEQGRVHHVGVFPELEQQLCEWTPESRTSPDRMDALVWAVTWLALTDVKRRRRSLVDAA